MFGRVQGQFRGIESSGGSLGQFGAVLGVLGRGLGSLGQFGGIFGGLLWGVLGLFGAFLGSLGDPKLLSPLNPSF